MNPFRALEAELAYRRSYDTGDFTSVAKVIDDLQKQCDALKTQQIAILERVKPIEAIIMENERLKAEVERLHDYGDDCFEYVAEHGEAREEE